MEFAVVLPGDDEEKKRYFVVEVAPLSSMPHAAHIFLEQVSHGLWDRAWFYINGPHVIQAGPQAEANEGGEEDEDPREVSLRPFKQLSLESLHFPEYSADFPHVPWTLGFTGRPGGPDFYLNKMDNTDAHGPGGQYQHDLEEFADPCFAKVIKGFDTLEDIARVPTILEGDYQYFFEYPVHIVKTIVLKNPIPVDEHELNSRKAGFGEIEITGSKDEGSSESNQHHKKHLHFKKPKIEHPVEP